MALMTVKKRRITTMKMKIASPPHRMNLRRRNHTSHLPRPNAQLNQVRKMLMKGKKEWRMMMNPPHAKWKHVVRYVRKVIVPIKGAP